MFMVMTMIVINNDHDNCIGSSSNYDYSNNDYNSCSNYDYDYSTNDKIIVILAVITARAEIIAMVMTEILIVKVLRQ